MTSVGHLWLQDFRVLRAVDIDLTPGLTVVRGENGQGKTSLLEAVYWIARTRSFRGVNDSMLVRVGAERAIVRAEVQSAGRTQLFEAEINTNGRNRVLCNRQPVARARNLYGLLRVSVFSPDDLALVKGGPAERREYLDELLAMLAVRYDAARSDYERVVKQRNALLRAGVRDRDANTTLDVFDEQLVSAGAELARGRLRLLDRLGPAVGRAYSALARDEHVVRARYDADWSPEPLTVSDVDAVEDLLRTAIAARRRAEIERGVTLIGPHRDEWRLTVNDLDARYQASQGEQRTLALALRLAGHHVVNELVGAAPVLLLDDVFSELDRARATALVEHLPEGQTLLTTAGALPEGVIAERTMAVCDGRVE